VNLQPGHHVGAFGVSFVGVGRPHISFQVWTWYTTRYWVIAILSGHIRWRCDLDLWPILFKIGSRD